MKIFSASFKAAGITILLLLISYSIQAQKWIDIKSTIMIDDTVYVKETGLPYTGLITEHYNDEVLIFKARCTKGVFEGDFIRFYNNGDTLEKGTFRKGKLHGYLYSYNQTNSFGSVSSNYCFLKTNYINGIRNGISESYFENGKIWIASEYRNDIQTGSCRINFETSNKSFRGTLHKGECDGEWILYSDDNSTQSKILFENGVAVSCDGNCDNISLKNSRFDDLSTISLGLK